MVGPGEAGLLFRASPADALTAAADVLGPTFEVDGRDRGDFAYAGQVDERRLSRSGREVTLRYLSPGSPNLDLHVALRAYPDSPVVRFRYQLAAETDAQLTRQAGRDRLRYLAIRGMPADAHLTEVQLSHFDPIGHAYRPNVEARAPDEIYDGLTFAGPIAVFHTADRSWLAAYEHGADHPQSFLEFRIEGRGPERRLSLAARGGNYYHGQPIGPTTPWRSVWFELALTESALPALQAAYRRFILEEICQDDASRRPHVYYNTWDYQERNRYFRKRPYLESMNFDRITAEIEVARRLGVDVFVIDTGWYEKTGDWQVHRGRFPDGLQEVRHRLEAHGMRLGLWFNPTVAALSSEALRTHPNCVMTRGARPVWQGPVWETEESVSMCLASDYADHFADTMVRLHDELGVTYFKWDGVSQYGCDSPLHHHGTASNTADERAACFAYQLGLHMIQIVERVAARRPGIIVDFDITEARRFVGLGFLAAGKYHLVNDGPYFSDFDIPADTHIEPNTINVFFYPGPARPRVCRQGSRFDGWVPAHLFLTHYLPDPPALSQRNNLASLTISGNGVWGDLLSLSPADVAWWAEHLADYKRVAPAVARSFPRLRGALGTSPEVHEKIDPETASGLVAFFTVAPGRVTHLTQPIRTDRLEAVKGADAWEATRDGRLRITVDLGRDDARVMVVVGG